MSKKVKVVKLNSKARSVRKEALVVYEGEKMTRAEREAKIRQKERPQEEAQNVRIRKGTKVAEASSSQKAGAVQMPKQEKAVVEVKAPAEKKEVKAVKEKKEVSCQWCAVLAKWYSVASKAVLEVFFALYKALEAVDAADDKCDDFKDFIGFNCFIGRFFKNTAVTVAKFFAGLFNKASKKCAEKKPAEKPVKKEEPKKVEAPKKAEAPKKVEPAADVDLDEETVYVKVRNVPEGYLKRFAKDTALGADNRYKECQDLVSELDTVLKAISAAKTPKDATEQVKEELNAKRAELRKQRDILENKLAVADATGRSLERSADIYAHVLEILTKVKPIDFRKGDRFEPKNLKISKSEIDKIIDKFEGYHLVERKVGAPKEETPAPVAEVKEEIKVEVAEVVTETQSEEVIEKTIEVQVRNVPEGYLKRFAKDTALGADNRYNECRDIIAKLNVVLADLGDAKTPADASEELKKELSDKRAALRKERDLLENQLKIADSTGRSLERSADIYARCLEVVTKEKGINFRKSERFEAKNTKISKAEIDAIVEKFEGTHTVVRTVKVTENN